MILKRIKKGLTLRWMVFLTLLTFLLLTITCLSILQIYPEDLKRSFIEVGGIVLILGIPFSFFLTRKLILPIRRSSKEMEQELVQRTRELQTVYEMGALINEHLADLDVVLPITLKKVASLTGYEMGAIFLLNEAGDVLEMKSQIGHSPAMLEEVKVIKFNEGVSGKAIRLKQPVIVSIREYPSPRIAPILREEGVQTVVGIPLLAKGKAIGAIIFSTRSPRKISQSEVNSLESIGSQVGLTLENSLLLNEIRKSEEKYRTVVESAIDGVCVIGRDYIFKYVNERLAEIRGYHREELIGTDFRNLLDEESRALLADREDKRARGIKLPPHFELNILHKDGGVRNAEISVSAIKDLKGDVNIIVFLKDVTERKQAEKTLRESEKRFRLLVEHSAETFFLHDLEGRFIDVNQRGCENLGYTREELLGMTIQDIEQDFILGRHQEKWERMVPGVPIIVEGVHKRKDGRTFPVEVHLGAFELGGRKLILGLVRNITERKQAEEALRQSEEEARRFSRENAVIAEIGRIVSSTLNIEEVYERFGEEVRKVIPFDRVSVSIVDLDRAFITVAYNFGVQIAGRQPGARIALYGPYYEDVVKRRSSILIQTEDESELAERYPYLLNHFRIGIRSFIGTPLISKNQLIGILHIQSLKPNAYTESDVRLAERVGNQIAGAIANAQLFAARQQAEEALRQSEEKYRSIVENIQDGYLEVDLAGNFTFVNDAECVNLGYTKEELTGMNNRQYMDKKSAKKVFQAFNRVYRTGEPVKGLDLEVIRKDGTEAFNEISVSLIRDSKGKPTGFRGISRDVTGRKRAEEAMRQSEERYRTIIENIQDGYFEVNLAGNFTFVNNAECVTHGYSRDELIGMNNRQYTDKDNAKKVFEAFNKLYRTGEPGRVLDYEIIRKDGTKAFTELSVSLIRDSEGKPIGFRGISRDVTERKLAEEALRQSEEKYRTILENIEDGYYEVDLAGNLTFFNDSLCRIYGYPKEELMGMNNRQYADKESAKKVFQAFNRVYKTGESGREFDWEIVRKDGTKRYIETSVSLRKDTSGKPAGFRGIVRDITEKKKVEEQLFQTEKLRAVGAMASGVAHDFNNALAAILGNTQLLLHTAHDEELKETLKIIEKVAKDSGQTVRRLQDFTRKRVGQELSKVDVNAIIKDSMEMTKPKWKDEPQGRGIRIEVVSNLEEIPSVSGNASELREVITNMIFNAIEAMPEGGKIEIRTFKKRRDVLIQISDTGIGITEETKKKIFEPFFTTKPFSNTGLGLSMSYGIIRRFGGEIEVESKLGQGTTFTIILPIGGEEKEEAVSLKAIKKGRQALILVIDDDEFVRSVLSRTLAQANHQVTLAESGEKGVEIFKEGKFDIVLTDLGLPGMSGWEVCRMIKEISPQTPVGMITGWGVEKNRSEVEEYGLDFFISKPFDFNQILNVVAETMASKEE